MWSLRETFNSSLTTPRYETAVNWYQTPRGRRTRARAAALERGHPLLFVLQARDDGLPARPASPPSSPSTTWCRTTPRDPSAGGLGRLSLFDTTIDTASPDRATATELGLPAGTIIFGLNLEYSPTCYDSSSPAGHFWAVATPARPTPALPPSSSRSRRGRRTPARRTWASRPASRPSV